MAYLFRSAASGPTSAGRTVSNFDDLTVALAIATSAPSWSVTLTAAGGAISSRLFSTRRSGSDNNNIGEFAETVLPRAGEPPLESTTTSPSNSKLKLISPITVTATPERKVGLNFH